MKKRFSLFAVFTALLLCLTAVLSACERGNTDSGGGSGKLTLSQTTLILDAGDSAVLIVIQNTDTAVTWTSSNTAVATVTDGTVYGAAKGSATITASADGKTGTCTVTVNELLRFTVTFVVNDGPGVEPQSVKDGEKAVRPEFPDNGYGVVNWYSDKAMTQVFNFDTEVISGGPRTLYAQWTANIYTITLDAQKGKISSGAVSVAFGSSYGLPVPARPGYAFLGWYTLQDGNGFKYTGEDGFSIEDWSRLGNITLYALWESVGYSDGLVYTLKSNDTYEVSAGEAAGQYEDIIEIEIVQGIENKRVVGRKPVDILDDEGDVIGQLTSYAEIIVPDEYEGKAVTSVAEKGFMYCWDTVTVVLPSTIASIGVSAFQECTSLEYINIPDSLKGIGDYAFSNCKKLDIDLDLPEGLATIGTAAFSGCTSIKEVTIPTTVASLPANAFYGCGATKLTMHNGLALGNNVFHSCPNLKSVVLPDAVYEFKTGMFANCASLQTVTLGKFTGSSMPYPSAFFNCPSLKEFILPSGNTLLSVEDGVLFNRAKTQLIAYPAARTAANYTVPATVTSFAGYAFDSASLDTITLPSGLTTLGTNCFSRSNIQSIVIPSGVTALPSFTFIHCSELQSVTLHSKITTIGYGAFQDCTALSGINIPESVTKIDSYAFYGCTSLKSITIPLSGGDVFGQSVFAECTNLLWVYFSKPVTSATILNCPQGLFNKTHNQFKLYVCDAASKTAYVTSSTWSNYVSGGLTVEVWPPNQDPAKPIPPNELEPVV